MSRPAPGHRTAGSARSPGATGPRPVAPPPPAGAPAPGRCAECERGRPAKDAVARMITDQADGSVLYVTECDHGTEPPG